jgi:hypothetical protein
MDSAGSRFVQPASTLNTTYIPAQPTYAYQPAPAPAPAPAPVEQKRARTAALPNRPKAPLNQGYNIRPIRPRTPDVIKVGSSSCVCPFSLSFVLTHTNNDPISSITSTPPHTLSPSHTPLLHHPPPTATDVRVLAEFCLVDRQAEHEPAPTRAGATPLPCSRLSRIRAQPPVLGECTHLPLLDPSEGYFSRQFFDCILPLAALSLQHGDTYGKSTRLCVMNTR